MKEKKHCKKKHEIIIIKKVIKKNQKNIIKTTNKRLK